MTKQKLKRLRRQLEALRARPANIRADELQRLVAALGRDREKKRRGEPMWISSLLPSSRPLSIPNHPGRLKRYTAGSILDQLEEDLDTLEEMLSGNPEQK
jgi:hypothetical protein